LKKKGIKINELLRQYKTPILYSGGSIAKAFSTMIVGFVLAKYISPEDLGLWASINLVLTYSVFFQGGLINGLNIELPYAYGKEEVDKAKTMAGTAQTFTVVSSIIILFIGLGCFFYIPIDDPKLKYGILSITCVILLFYYQNYLMSTFRSKNSFLKLSVIQIVDAFVNLISLILVIYYSFYGLLIKAVFVLAIYVTLLHFWRPIKVSLIWNKDAFLKLSKIGLPIFGLVLLDSFSSTADKLWLLNFSSLADVGLYSFGFYALSMFSLFSISVAGYVYPRMTYNYGKNNDKLEIWKYVKKITGLLIIIQVPLAIISYYLIPILITRYFPNYVSATFTMQILLFAGVLKGCVVGVNALWSLKSWKHMVIYQLIYSLLLFSLSYLGVQFYANKIEGVAYGILLANGLNLISGLYITYLATNKHVPISN
jgi:O-antigen/teichoic acid export membrane protein